MLALMLRRKKFMGYATPPVFLQGVSYHKNVIIVKDVDNLVFFSSTPRGKNLKLNLKLREKS